MTLLFLNMFLFGQKTDKVYLKTFTVIDMITVKPFGCIEQEKQVQYRDSINEFIIDIQKHNIIWNNDTLNIADYSYYDREKYFVFLLEFPNNNYKYFLYYVEKDLLLFCRYKQNTDTWFF